MIHIVFVPPSGLFKKQDFSIQRILRWLHDAKDIKTTLVYIKSSSIDFAHLCDEVIELGDEEDIFERLERIKFDILFNRGWMHSYNFSKKLVERFDNVVVNIKDWNFSSKEQYEFLFANIEDFEAIEYIFKNAKYILSHYTKEQSRLWSNEYKVPEDKFLFFPEYCNEENFSDKNIIYKNIKLVYAGKIHKTNLPEQLFPAKSHLRSIDILTSKGIGIDFVLPEEEYENVLSKKDDFIDFLYEDKFNNNFNLIKGKKLSPDVLSEYHFGFFELETSGRNKSLYRYAVTSKFAFYLESATPMLVNKDFESISDIVLKYNLGIVFVNKDLDNIEKLFDISNEEYQEFVDNIKFFRTSFTYNSNSFMKEVII